MAMFQHYPFDATLCRKLLGHTDGLWEVSTCLPLPSVVGTASSDATARLWHTGSGACVAIYREHRSSVNSIRFHPTQPLVCTAAGDGSIHLWPVTVELPLDSDERAESSADTPSPLGPPADGACRLSVSVGEWIGGCLCLCA
jgi:WD40 repeat protein